MAATPTVGVVLPVRVTVAVAGSLYIAALPLSLLLTAMQKVLLTHDTALRLTEESSSDVAHPPLLGS